MSGEEAVETLVVQLAGLELTISARRLPGGVGGSSSAGSFEIVQAATSTEAPEEADLASSGIPVAEIETRALQARTAADCAELVRLLPFLDPLVAKLSASSGEWTPAARIGRAYRAGVLAGLRLEGPVPELDSLGVPFRNIYYLVLRGSRGVSACWTTSYQTYLSKVGRPGQKFEDESVSQALPSHAEATAFLAGAGQKWPPKAE